MRVYGGGFWDEELGLQIGRANLLDVVDSFELTVDTGRDRKR